MPKIDGVGFSEYTGVKMQIFSEILHHHFSVIDKIRGKYGSKRYAYYDFTAGKGRNPNGVAGSPIIFLNTAIDHNFRDFEMHLFEREEKNIQELQYTFCEERCNRFIDREIISGCAGYCRNFPVFHKQELLNYSISFYKEDSMEMIPKHAGKIFGLAFYDPSGNPVDFEKLKKIFSHDSMDKIDILLNAPCTANKRVEISTHDTLRLPDKLSTIGKRLWYITRPITKQHWSFLYGTNYKIGSNNSCGLYQIESQIGTKYLEKASFSSKERAKKQYGQLYLFDII